jgi:hypothetical protein
MQAFGTQNFNDPKVEQLRQAELVKLGRVVETKRNELLGGHAAIFFEHFALLFANRHQI